MSPNKLTALMIAVTLLSAAALAAAPINGHWVTQNKDAIVEISACATSVCGKIIKFLVTPPQGAGQKDIHNPDKALRSRTILGMNILSGFKAHGNEWRGQIYDPKTGKTYRSIVHRAKSGNLVVKGCVGPFCQAQTWTVARQY